MSLELRLLAYSVALLLVLVLIQANANVRVHGATVLAGNRDALPPLTGFAARTKRLVDNMRENLLLFAPLVLIAAVMDVSNFWTVLGARLFFYSRVAHAAIYLAGWPMIRPIAWIVGVVGCTLIFLALFGILQ